MWIPWLRKYFCSPSGLRIALRTLLQSSLPPLVRLFLLPDPLLLLCPRFSQTNIVSTGFSTCCPSLTPSGLCLGPDLPWADEPSPGNLRFSTVKIHTSLSLLIPAFSLLLRPHVLPVMLLPTTLRSPTNVLSFRSFGKWFSPVDLRRRLTRLVSYYALFE